MKNLIVLFTLGYVTGRFVQGMKNVTKTIFGPLAPVLSQAVKKTTIEVTDDLVQKVVFGETSEDRLHRKRESWSKSYLRSV